MSGIDKRTGKEFPSVTRMRYREAFGSLAKVDPGIRQTIVNLDAADARVRGDSRNDWTLTLDPYSLRQYGALSDTHILPEEAEEGDGDSINVRPVEWFTRLGEVVADDLSGDDEIWGVINRIFGQAIAQVDRELGFAEEA